MVRRQVCIQRSRNEGLGMPYLESQRLAEKLAYLGRSSVETKGESDFSSSQLRPKANEPTQT